MEINNEEDEIPLPKPIKKKDKTGENIPPASKDKLISSTSRVNRFRKPKDLEEREIKKEEQIYNKNKEEEEKKKEEEEETKKKNVQNVFMKPNGSFVFQTLIEFHQVYTIVYFIIEELLFVYKCAYLDFPEHSASLEIIALIFYLFIQLGRFYFGSLGNRAEASMFVIMSFVFSIVIAFTYMYYMLLQTYVLRIELITNSIGMVLWGFESAFCFLAFLSISGKESGI